MEVGQPVWIRIEAGGHWRPAYIEHRTEREREGYLLGIRCDEDDIGVIEVSIKSLTEDLEHLKVILVLLPAYLCYISSLECISPSECGNTNTSFPPNMSSPRQIFSSVITLMTVL